MVLAKRMICGLCSHEQPVGDKPCASCGVSLGGSKRSAHWEGGTGCRNTATMSRKDRKKYTSKSKTVSKRALRKKRAK